ncbi:hypothetical protein AMATHDRAFT_62559 [Amanita thiersii Skay4041]|uniref:Uncharacterized protein n=1 Tax=Amanita thiersii Skay4041 TaxID=703135 RepID=A0A2A9NPV0_9AGAR|nr:hypothetical protein AMATHDRAFT_62559 [Amanita thiersii Skay4041]
MTLIEKVYFPPPPPTTNTLTPRQRAHLRRSTKKLTQILGVTPHLVDMNAPSISLDALLKRGLYVPESDSPPNKSPLSPFDSRSRLRDSPGGVTSLATRAVPSNAPRPQTTGTSATSSSSSSPTTTPSASSLPSRSSFIDFDDDEWSNAGNVCLMGSAPEQHQQKHAKSSQRPPVVCLARGSQHASTGSLKVKPDSPLEARFNTNTEQTNHPYSSSYSPVEIDEEEAEPRLSTLFPTPTCVGDDHDRLDDYNNDDNEDEDDDEGDDDDDDGSDDVDDDFKFDMVVGGVPPVVVVPPSWNEFRRKKMAKLHSRLGDNVPISLVFPAKRSDESDSESDLEREGKHGKKRVSDGEVEKERKESLEINDVAGFQHRTDAPHHHHHHHHHQREKLASGTSTSASTSSSPSASMSNLNSIKSRIAATCDSLLFPYPYRAPRKSVTQQQSQQQRRRSRTISICSKNEDGGEETTVLIERNEYACLGHPFANWEFTAAGMKGVVLEESLSASKLRKHGSFLRTIFESPDEYRDMDERFEGELEREEETRVSSEWYLSDAEGDEGRIRKERVVLDEGNDREWGQPMAVPERTWSHRRKPPPAYEP